MGRHAQTRGLDGLIRWWWCCLLLAAVVVRAPLAGRGATGDDHEEPEPSGPDLPSNNYPDSPPAAPCPTPALTSDVIVIPIA